MAALPPQLELVMANGKTNLGSLAKYLALGTAVAAVTTWSAQAQQIELIVVTAERHAENEQNVPLSVTTESGDQLNAIFESGADIKAIANHIPDVYAESSNGRVAPRFYIRGLGNTDFDLAASQPVSIIMDNVVMENTVLKSAPVYDQADVEVSRGPQGTLFGRNTTAGVIKFASKRPTQDLDGLLSASYGELGTLNADGAIGGALTDTVSVRVSGQWVHRDNYINNAFTHVNNALGGYDEGAARVQLLFKPNDKLSVLLNVHGWTLDGTAAIFRANIIGPGNNHLNSNYVWNKVYFDGGANNPQKYNTTGGAAEIAYDFGNMTLTSITGYEATHGFSRGDIDGGNMVTGPGFIPFPSDTQDGLDYLHQFTQELHLASDATSPLFWQVGAFYFTTDYEDQTNPFFVPPTFVRQTNTSWAVFGQASYKVTDALALTGGVRWTDDSKGMTAHGPIMGPPITTPVKLTGSNISWDVSAEYTVNDDVNLYARVATGFRAPSIQGRNLAFGSPYSTARSETLTSYEAGVKSELLDKKVRFNLDGFYYYLRHPQFSAIGGAGNSVVLMNARGGLAYGMEADAEYAATDQLTFTGGASWTHTEIRDPNLTTAICAQCTVTNPVVGGNAVLNGNPFPQAPDFMLSMTARYGIPLSNGGELFAYTDWWLQGYTNFFLYKSKEFHTNGNYEGGLRLGYISPSKGYEIALYGRNITDKANLQGGIDFNNNTGFVGDPRVVGIEFTTHIH